MTLNNSITISCVTLVMAGAAIVFVANAQSPARPHRIVRVVSNTVAPVAAPRPAAPVSAPAPVVPEVLINRETYSYPDAGRRDPFT